MRKTNRVRSKN